MARYNDTVKRGKNKKSQAAKKSGKKKLNYKGSTMLSNKRQEAKYKTADKISGSSSGTAKKKAIKKKTYVKYKY